MPTSWSFQEVVFLIRPNGAGRGHWQWLLTSPLLVVCVSMGKWNGGIAQVRCSSEYLWSAPSLETALQQVHDFLREFFGCDLYLQVSEVHLCADVAGWGQVADLDYQRVFVSRSRKRADHLEADWNIDPGGEFTAKSFSYGLTRTGLEFSARGLLSCALYDKSRELKKTGKQWFEDLWSLNGWEDGETVWRVEFRFKREALHELKLDGAFHGIENAYDLPRHEKRQASKWKLVYVPEPAEPLPGVEAVRARWLGKWALLRVASEKWVRVKVYRVTNDGDVLIGVVRTGVFLPWAALRMEHIPLLLRPVEE